jgi:hypothetical protein
MLQQGDIGEDAEDKKLLLIHALYFARKSLVT